METTGWHTTFNHYLTPKRQRLILIGLLVVYSLFLTYHINGPFIGTGEAFTGMFGMAAANWVRIGPIELKFAQMTPYGAQSVAPEITKDFYLNHPQFFIAPAALSYFLFGVGEWQTRLAPIIFSLLSLLVFWTLIQRIFKNPALTVISSFFYALFPLSIFYGRMLVHESTTIFFVLALFLSLILFEQEQRRGYAVALCAITFLGGLIDWQFFFAAATAWGYVLLKKEYPRRAVILVLIFCISAASLGVTLFQVGSIAHMNPIVFFQKLYSVRYIDGLSLNVIPLLLISRTIFDFQGFSEIAMILTALGAVSYIVKNRRRRDSLLYAMLFTGTGFLTYAVFPGQAGVHQMTAIYFVPLIALMAAQGLVLFKNARVAGVILALFVVSCLWYTFGIFGYKSFAVDDFAMLKRANAAIPAAEPVCMGQSAVNTNIKFYLFPHQMDNLPCSSHSYFVLRRPESYENRDPSSSLLQSILTDSFKANSQKVSFTAAVAAKVIRAAPPLKRLVERMYAGHDPHAYYPAAAKQIRDTIQEQELSPLDCSTNFCLYGK